MTLASAAESAEASRPNLWRMALIALCALILCSCRGPVQQAFDPSTVAADGYPSLPPAAYGSQPAVALAADRPIGPSGTQQPAPLPYMAGGPWAPPGISQPWPKDEYLQDGGDRELPVAVGNQWQVEGLEPEDCVAHFDTLDGRTLIEPSNRVYVYSPRFGAVRQVVSLVSNDKFSRAAGVYLPTGPVGPTSTQPVASSTQNILADRQVGAKLAGIFRSRQGDGAMSTTDKAREFEQDSFLPYENVKLIREGILDEAEMARLTRGATAALAWTARQAAQVILDETAAMADVSDQGLQSVFTVKAPPGEVKLRVIKVADKQFAEPGEEVAFTIRFDNVGNQLIGNVTIIDNLTTRLEYIADSARCSLDARFFTEPSQGDSVVIRCEIADPVAPGAGGVIRFRCVVR